MEADASLYCVSRVLRQTPSARYVRIRAPDGACMAVIEDFFLPVEVNDWNRESVLEAIRKPEAPNIGELLFQIAFPQNTMLLGPYLRAFAQSQGRNNRLRLRIQTDDPDLGSLSWERLRVPDGLREEVRAAWDPDGILPPPTELGTLADHQIVRDYTSGRTPQLAPLGTLKILAAWANPGGTDWPSVPSVAFEAATVADTLTGDSKQAIAEIRNAGPVTKETLFHALREFQPEMLHFAGHGHSPVDWPQGPPEPCLVLGEEGAAEYVTADELAPALEAAGVRIVVLNCCHGATSSRFHASFAHRLMSSPQRNKLSVIVAHQWRINVAQAGIFLRVFYEALARGEEVDSAVQAFRTQSTSWALPVVFLGDANAKVFAPTANDPYPLDLGQYLGPYEFFVQQHRVTDRRFLRDAIEDFAGSLIREKKGGIFHLLGPPGFGKTSFLWSYVNRSPDKPPHFAYRAGNSLLQDPGDALRHLYRQVLPFARLAEKNPQIGLNAFQKLLTDAGQKFLARGEVLRIVVDALDEAKGKGWPALDIIGDPVPPGVCWIVSSRPGQLADSLATRKSVRQLAMEEAKDQNAADAATACAMVLQSEFPEAATGTGDRLNTLAEKLARRAEANFLALRYFFEDHLAHGSSLAEIEAAEVHLTGSLTGVYQDFFEKRVEQKLEGLREIEAATPFRRRSPQPATRFPRRWSGKRLVSAAPSGSSRPGSCASS